MGRPAQFDVETKIRVVLSVLGGECSAAEVAGARSGNARWRPMPSSSSWRWPRRTWRCVCGRRARTTRAGSLRRPRDDPSRRWDAGLEVRSPGRHPAPHLPPSPRGRPGRWPPGKGPWPAPVVDLLEPVAAKYAEDWPAWGHRKIAAMMRADGHQMSTSTVERALRRRDLLLPQGFRADRRAWAVARREVFVHPPARRNRV